MPKKAQYLILPFCSSTNISQPQSKLVEIKGIFFCEEGKGMQYNSSQILLIKVRDSSANRSQVLLQFPICPNGASNPTLSWSVNSVCWPNLSLVMHSSQSLLIWTKTSKDIFRNNMAITRQRHPIFPMCQVIEQIKKQ